MVWVLLVLQIHTLNSSKVDCSHLTALLPTLACSRLSTAQAALGLRVQGY
jgi:hypothetical protein